MAEWLIHGPQVPQQFTGGSGSGRRQSNWSPSSGCWGVALVGRVMDKTKFRRKTCAGKCSCLDKNGCVVSYLELGLIMSLGTDEPRVGLDMLSL